MVIPVAAAASVPCSETSTKALWTTSEIARLRFGSMPEKSALLVKLVGMPMAESALRRENSDSARNFGKLNCTFRVARAASQPVRFTRFEAMRSDTVEIVIGDVVVRAGGDVEPDRLADVIRVVRKA